MSRMIRNFHRKQPLKFLLFFLTAVSSVILSVSFLLADEAEKISRAEFIEILARSQPGHALLPPNPQMPRDKLFLQTNNNLKKRGIHVWDNKDPEGTLTHLELVRVAYAFSGGPRGQSLFDQKLFLKQRGIISSTDVGLTTQLDGTAIQYPDNEAGGKPLQVASPIFMGDRIHTDAASRAALTFDDMSVLTMAENTDISITKHVFNPDKGLRQTLVNVSVGTVRFVVSKARGAGSMFKVVTPTATAGVRGTEFVVMVKPDGQTRFIGIENEIVTASSHWDKKKIREEIVGPGTTRVFSAAGEASAVTSVSKDLMRRVRQETKLSRKSHKMKTLTRDRAQRVAALVKETENKGRKAFREGAKAAEDAAKEAAKAAEDAAEEAAKTGEDAAKEAAKAAEDAAEEAARAAEDAAEEAAEDAAEEAAEEATEEATKAAEDAAEEAAKAAEDAAKEAARAAEDAAKEAARLAEEALEDLSGSSGSGGNSGPG